MIIIIAAYDKNRIIGKDQKLPWKIPAEMAFFKDYIKNKTILIGKNTFESIKTTNTFKSGFILSDKITESQTKNLEMIDDAEKIISLYKGNPNSDIYILGGEQVYELFVDAADEFIISHINGEHNGNKYFPTWAVQVFDKRITLVEDPDFTTIKYSK